MRVLIFTSSYLPGFKGGGPIRTIANMVEALGGGIDFFLVTLDRDLGDSAPYPDVKPDAWQQVGKARVYYASPSNSFLNILKIIRYFQGDALHLNSFFSFRFSIFPLLVARCLRPNLPIILGPRGEFSEGALALKIKKKKFYISFARSIRLYKHVIWHASTIHEAQDIRRVMGSPLVVREAIDIAAPKASLEIASRISKAALRVIFLARISPMKNLLGAIEILRQVKCSVDFHVYGPAEDLEYFNTCQSALAYLPRNVTYSYYGPLHPDVVSQKLAEYDLFFLPTLGENFGHVIAEALYAGLPVLISKNTPWCDLEAKRLGWDLALEEPDAFARCIDICYAKSATEYKLWRHEIREWALRNIGSQEAVEQNRQLFIDLKESNGH